MSRLQAAAHAAPLMLSVFIAVLSDREYGARKRRAVCGPERVRTSGKRAHLRALSLLHGRADGSYVQVQTHIWASGLSLPRQGRNPPAAARAIAMTSGGREVRGSAGTEAIARSRTGRPR